MCLLIYTHVSSLYNQILLNFVQSNILQNTNIFVHIFKVPEVSKKIVPQKPSRTPVQEEVIEVKGIHLCFSATSSIFFYLCVWTCVHILLSNSQI